MATLVKLFHNFFWALAFVAFNRVPKEIQWILAQRHCSIAAQWVHKYVDQKCTFVYLAEIHNEDGYSSGHFMNVQGGFFTDLYGNKIPAVKIGKECEFRRHDGCRYVVVAAAREWTDFGFESLRQMIKETAELNEFLYRTRG